MYSSALFLVLDLAKRNFLLFMFLVVPVHWDCSVVHCVLMLPGNMKARKFFFKLCDF